MVHGRRSDTGSKVTVITTAVQMFLAAQREAHPQAGSLEHSSH